VKHNIFYRSIKKLKSSLKFILPFIILASIIITLFPHFFRNTYTVTISNRQIKTHGNKKTYIIYAQLEDGSIKAFKDKNSLVEFKFNSEDIYRGLQIYRKYEIKTYGFRITFLSCYENIVNVKKLKDNFIYPYIDPNSH
jgi:DNA-binding transcriptional regulator WhiA